MRRHSTFSLLLSICIAFQGCSVSAGRIQGSSSSQAISENLARAVARMDKGRALELVVPVLEDEAGGEYRFDYEARWNTANAIRDLRLIETIPLLRKVASLSYPALVPSGARAEDSRRDLLKNYAIKSALSGLTLLGDSEAVMLNRLHIASPVISSTAIRNLKSLKNWESTEQIRRILADREPTHDAFLDLSAALDFLAASTVSRPQDCAILRRLTTTYGSCFDARFRPPGIAGCEELIRAERTFEARFKCSDR
jgi:hypothetical protein